MIKTGVISGLILCASLLLSAGMAQAAPEECPVINAPGQCICHNFAAIEDERCPSDDGVESGHSCHHADWCCSTIGPFPPGCNFPTLDCELVNHEGGVEDKFGKCNGCGDAIPTANPDCCDPDLGECPDPDNLCEECDDGANVDGDGCSADCQLEECGDGNIDPFEECDDGNTDDGDGCDNNCQEEECGDGIVNDGDEECDDGNEVDDDACRNDCTTNFCGDGVSGGAGEQCDGDDIDSCSQGQACDEACNCCPDVNGDGDCDECSENADCVDENVCNGAETCVEGSCEPGTDLDCTDQNPCTDNSCDPTDGCQVENNTDFCDDENACTIEDVCAEGECGGRTLTCDDENPCTDDSCSERIGCVFTPDTENSCSDGDACNGVEACNDQGGCDPGSSPDCDDDNFCTEDSCDPELSCQHAPLSGGPETCGIGECERTADICIEGQENACEPGDPTDEICDDLDNDCDGEVDEEGVCDPEDEPEPEDPPTEPAGQPETPTTISGDGQGSAFGISGCSLIR